MRYQCQNCEQRFEEQADPTGALPACPACGSSRVAPLPATPGFGAGAAPACSDPG